MLFTATLSAQIQNNVELIANGDFSGAALVSDASIGAAAATGAWIAGDNTKSTFTPSIVGTGATANFSAVATSAAGAIYDHFLGQITSTALTTGRYHIALKAKGDQPFYLKISGTDALGTEYSSIVKNAVGAVDRTGTGGYSIKFTPASTSVSGTIEADLDISIPTSATARLYFVFPTLGTVELDDISLKRTGEMAPIPTTYFVRPTGNTTAWTGLTGITPDQIITTTELTLTGTYTYYLAAGNYTLPANSTITTGKVYGGFSGNETNIDLTDMSNNPRATSDKDGNGIVEPWEFTNESTITTTLTGNKFTSSTAASSRLLIVTGTGGEVNGVTVTDYFSSAAGAICLGVAATIISNATNSTLDKAGVLRLCTVKKIKNSGGGIVMSTNKFSVIDRCLVESNVVTFPNGGGAVFLNACGGKATSSVIRNNATVGTGSTGAGVYATSIASTDMDAIVENCVVHNNYSLGNSGAIRGAAQANKRGIEIINCTIVNNQTATTPATGSGSVELISGGIIVNSIIAGDSSSELRANTTNNYIVNTAYGTYATSASVLYSSGSVANNEVAAFNFKYPTAFAGVMIPDYTTPWDQAKYDAIRKANFTMAAAPSSVAAGIANYPTSYQIGGTGATITLSTYSISSTDLLGVSRGINIIGAYQLVDPATTVTWNGSAWSNGTGPTASLEAVIDGTYTGAAFDAKKLTVNATKSLTVTGGTMTIQNEVVNNGTMVIENNANLIQVNNVVNTGAITVKRNSNPLKRLDYTLWASPVARQNLAAFSPLTSQSPNRFYTYDTANNQFSNSFDPTATNFIPGRGYLIRMPNDADATNASAFAGQFTGVPTNGDVYYTLSTSGNKFNLVGNPYPSPISISNLLAFNTAISNVIDATFYLWRKTNGVATVNSSAYCVYNVSSSTYTANGVGASSFDGIIQPGQGFFVKAWNGGSLVFKNSFRVANTNNTSGQFFKPKQASSVDKIWLNATNAAGDFSQMAVTYSDGATAGVDSYDSESINDSDYALTSSIKGGDFTIQGRPTFDASDVVSLNFKSPVAGQYTIAIDHGTGVFAAGQSVVLADAITGTETDLTTSAYTFNAPAGAANGRFSLKYQKAGINPSELNTTLTVYQNKGIVYVNAGNIAIGNIKVYDIQGKLVHELKNVNSTLASIENLKATNQVLVVKITLQDNQVITKKIVN